MVPTGGSHGVSGNAQDAEASSPFYFEMVFDCFFLICRSCCFVNLLLMWPRDGAEGLPLKGPSFYPFSHVGLKIGFCSFSAG